MSFRRQGLFNTLPSRSMLNNMLIDPWIGSVPELPLLGAQTFERDLELMSSVLDILEPLALLQRMDRMINRWIGRRPRFIRRRPVPFRLRRIRRNIRGGRRQQRQRAWPIRRRVRQQLPQQLFMRRSVSVNQPMRQQRRQRVRSLSAQRVTQPTWQQQQPRQVSNIPAWRPQRQPRQPSIGRGIQLPVSFGGQQQMPIQKKQRRQQQFGGQQFGGQQFGGRQLPIQSTGVKQQQRMRSVSQQRGQQQFGKQLPIQTAGLRQQKMRSTSQQRGQQQQQQQFGRQLPIQTTGGRQQQGMRSVSRQRGQSRQLGEARSCSLSLGRQVPIQSQSQKFAVNQPKRGTSWTRSNIGKMAQPVTGMKLPQLYRICLDTQACDPKNIKCNVQKSPTGQYNMLITGCGPYRRCYTLPNTCDPKRMKKYLTREDMCVIECPLLEESPRCLDIATQPQIREDSVTLKVNIPEFIDPNKVQVNLRDNDLILRFESKVATEECCTRVHYYNKVTLPRETDLDMLKCQSVKGCLIITAPIIGGRKQAKQPKQPQLGRPVSGVRGQREVSEARGVIQPKRKEKMGRNIFEPEETRVRGTIQPQRKEKQVGGAIQPEKKEKMRHRKLLKLQQQQQGQQEVPIQKQKGQQQKGVQPTTKVSQKAKLPKPEETRIGGVSKQAQGKQAQGKQAGVTPTTPVTKPKQQKKEKKQQDVQSPLDVGQVEPKKQQQGKKEKQQMKGQKEGQQEGRITGSQQLHDIFRNVSGRRSPTGQQQGQTQMTESMGRTVSPTQA